MKKKLLIITGLLLAGCQSGIDSKESSSSLEETSPIVTTPEVSSSEEVKEGYLVGKYPTIPGVPTTKEIDGQVYQFAWADEFSGTELNEDYWSYEVMGGGGNQELQYYTIQNSSFASGAYIITALKQQYMGKDYTSSRIKTSKKVSFKYGYVEAKMAIPSFTGAWPAFWMLGQNYDNVGWPRCGEIDIMESVNTNEVVHATLHYGNNHQERRVGSKTIANGDSKTNFHTYSMVWNEESITTYFDGELFGRAYINTPGLEAFHNEFYFIINLAIGGDWPGEIVDDEALPQNMIVDYVRVYQI